MKGNFKDGVMDGHGKFEWINKEIYIGEWYLGKMTGLGVKLQADGSRLEGSFLDSKLDGWAKKLFIAGDRYEGYFIADKRNGYGY